MDRHIVQSSRGSIEYTLVGRGPVVLVIHGVSSDCSSGMDPPPLLEAGLSVLTLSRPDMGAPRWRLAGAQARRRM